MQAAYQNEIKSIIKIRKYCKTYEEMELIKTNDKKMHKIINDNKVEERSEKVEQDRLKYLEKEPKNENMPIIKTDSSLNFSGDEIIKVASKAKNGQKFLKLWNGDISSYKTQSIADLALCNILSFYTQADPEKINSLFRKSGLYSEKWNQEDYRNNTINAAIKATKKTYDPNYNSSTAKENCSNTHLFGVSETPNGYIYTSLDKQGNEIVKFLSNFIIKVKKMIQTEEETFIIAEVGNDFYKVKRSINIKAFDNKAKFLDSISDLNFYYKGKDDNLQDIKYIVSQQDYNYLVGVKYIGFNTVNDKKVFVTNTKAIDENLNIVENTVITEDKVVIKTNILEAEEITAYELKRISPYLFKFNNLEITSSILGTITTFFLKPLWFDNGVKSKHLYLWGEAGAGKSETRRNIIEPFFSLQGSNTLDCNNITQFSLNKYVGSSNVFPVILEEYKPWKMKQVNIDIISGVLRNTYDMVNGIRGNKDQGLNEYPEISPIVCVGEALQSETATKERGMIVNFSKKESRTSERRNAFNELSKTESKKTLQKLGRSILNFIIKTDINEILKMREIIIHRNLAEMQDDRVNDTVINAIVGINLIVAVYKQVGLDFEEETGLKKSIIFEAINRNCFNEIMDGNNKTKSVIDNTMELISTMKSNEIIQKNKHYTYVNNDSELAININLLFDCITKYIKDYAVDGEFLTNKTQFCKQLQKTEYFLARKAVKFSLKHSGSSELLSETNTVKAYVLNIEKLKQSGLEVDELLP